MPSNIERSGAERLDVIVLTFNEARNIGRCLHSLAPLVANVFVVDSGSTDDTVSICEQRGATVFVNKFESHSSQWLWALRTLPLSGDWVLGLDADQRLSPELADAITRFLASPASGCNGVYLCRRQVFRGKWIRHGGYYPKLLLKLFRRNAINIEPSELVDHHFRVGGQTRRLQGDLIEENANEANICAWVAKHNQYAVLQAHLELGSSPKRGQFWGSPDDRVDFLKSVWYRLPLYLRPALYFGYRYFLRLGFLDGKAGFVFHFLQGYWYRLLVDINIEELKNARASSKDGQS